MARYQFTIESYINNYINLATLKCWFKKMKPFFNYPSSTTGYLPGNFLQDSTFRDFAQGAYRLRGIRKGQRLQVRGLMWKGGRGGLGVEVDGLILCWDGFHYVAGVWFKQFWGFWPLHSSYFLFNSGAEVCHYFRKIGWFEKHSGEPDILVAISDL